MSGLKFVRCATMTFAAMLLLAGCVSQQKYDALQSRYDQLNQTMSSEISSQPDAYRATAKRHQGHGQR